MKIGWPNGERFEASRSGCRQPGEQPRTQALAADRSGDADFRGDRGDGAAGERGLGQRVGRVGAGAPGADGSFMSGAPHAVESSAASTAAARRVP